MPNVAANHINQKAAKIAKAVKIDVIIVAKNAKMTTQNATILVKADAKDNYG
jgi:hypothetical protein